MKTMIKTVAKMLAKWLIGYLPDVAVWAIKQGADKTKDSEKTVMVLGAVKRIATDAALVARIMEDGQVSEQEEIEVRTSTMELVEDLEGLL